MSRTYIREIYDSFLSSVSDYALLAKNIEEIEDDLFTYFRKARARFYKCKNRLDITKDDEGDIYFGYIDKKSGELVDVTLTDFEILILTKLMLSSYMEQNVIATEVMKQSLSDKDFKIYSQANQLRELSLLFRQVDRQAMKLITEYTYMGMTDS